MTVPRSLLSQDNRLFQLARRGEVRVPGFTAVPRGSFGDRVIYPLLSLFFAWLTPFLATILGLPLFVIAAASGLGAEDGLAVLAQLVGAFVPIFFLVWGWLWLFERRPPWTVGLERPALRPYLRGLLVGLGLFLAVMMILALSGNLAFERPGLAPAGPQALTFALLLLIGWVVQGAAEEVLARGLLMPIIGVRWGAAAGVALSSLLFAVLHLFNPNVSPASLLNLALFGVFTSLYALYEGGLWGVCAMHAIWNWAQGHLFGLPISGNPLGVGLLFDFMETGPDWLTGGAFGPEGGAAVTVVLLVASALLFVAHRRRLDNEPPAREEQA